ncbi:hypothetical protein L484_007245 [Morus notabilis]|uniref:Uncharacterized protein n=1 Tax=Morus notabilis TaxID=981085 RepID=W9RC60_9ROSA|nr:hypothetical protein L484_007245 [Morus notabilis]
MGGGVMRASLRPTGAGWGVGNRRGSTGWVSMGGGVTGQGSRCRPRSRPWGGWIILDVTSDMAAAEVGGGPWFNTWKGKTATPESVRQALNVPVDVEGFFNFAPFFKPPGL